MDFVNKECDERHDSAHTDGKCAEPESDDPAMDAYSLGQLFYFFEFACGVGGYLLGVNPFNQPGVESYKKNMFALLGKPGYEEAERRCLRDCKGRVCKKYAFCGVHSGMFHEGNCSPDLT